MGCIISCSTFAVKRLTMVYLDELYWTYIQLLHMAPEVTWAL